MPLSVPVVKPFCWIELTANALPYCVVLLKLKFNASGLAPVVGV